MTTLPIPLVHAEPNGTFKVNAEAVEHIQTLESEIIVIVITGIYRSGKSFLLNAFIERAIEQKILNDPERSETCKQRSLNANFQIGSTVQACTKGISMHSPLYLRNCSIPVLILDSEGLSSTNKDQNYDLKLFSLSLLLCSTLIYNSRGMIDSHALEDLSLMLQISNQIQKTVHSSSEFPFFIWAVRDFTLQLLDSQHAPISSKQYLERALHFEKSEMAHAKERNAIRNSLKKAFKARECVTMARPMIEEDILQSANICVQDLREEFLTDLDTLLQCALEKQAKIKRVNGNIVNGAMYCTLLYAYVDALNSDKIIVISDAWKRAVHAQYERAMHQAIAIYEREMRDRVRVVSDSAHLLRVTRIVEECKSMREVQNDEVENFDLPAQESELKSVHSLCKKKAKAHLKAQKTSDIDLSGFSESLTEAVEETYKLYQQKNERASTEFCRSLLRHLLDTKFCKEPNAVVASATELHQCILSLLSKESDDLYALYCRCAIGPSAHAVLAEYMSQELVDRVIQMTEKCNRAHLKELSILEKQMQEKKASAERAAGEAFALEKVCVQQLHASETAVAEQEQHYALELANMQNQLRLKTAELINLQNNNATLQRLADTARDGQCRAAEYVQAVTTEPFAGYLLVMSSTKWVQRYLVLKDQLLRVFDTKFDYERNLSKLSHFDLTNASIQSHINNLEVTFLHGQSAPLLLTSPSISELEQWKKALSNAAGHTILELDSAELE